MYPTRQPAEQQAALQNDSPHSCAETFDTKIWVRDLSSGTERQLTNLAADFNVRDFDISPDGGEAVLKRVQDRSDVVFLDLSEQ
jgi:hypothetical protein